MKGRLERCQPFGSSPPEARTYAEIATDSSNECFVKVAQQVVVSIEVKRFEKGSDLREAGSAAVIVRKGRPVLVGPSPGDPCLPDRLVVFAFHVDRHRQPCESGRRLDQVAIAPVASGVLNVVVEYELVDGCDQIEITLPGDIVRLNDCNSLCQSMPSMRDAC